MSDFDDLRNLADDDDDFSFDKLDFDDGEIPFDKIGKTIGEEDDDEDWDDDAGASGGGASFELPEPVAQLIGSMNSLERMILSIMLFANVFVIGIVMLLLTGRMG
jgi:HEAT repeat protein